MFLPRLITGGSNVFFVFFSVLGLSYMVLMVHGHPFHVNPWNGCNPPIRFNRLQLEKKPSPMNSPFNHHTREESTNLTMTQVAHVVSVQLNSRKTAAYDETLMKFSWCFFWLVVYLPLWKYESQLGWLFPVYGKNMFQTTNQYNIIWLLEVYYPMYMEK